MRRLTTRIVLCLAALAAAAPASALAQAPTGGSEAPTGPPSPFAISGGGNALLGKKVRFRGAVEPRFAGHTVLVQYLDPATQAWTKQARTTVKPDGKFIARWKARRIGQFRMRALIGGEAQTASASPELPLTVFRPAIATWYGPGFYGNQTACGMEMTKELVGVAHRSLPCGTNVAVRYGKRTLVVPVVDRGPFSGKAKWDLTAAAAQQLGFTHTDRIGAIRLAPAAQASR
ncbi:MAG TPA: septal ring lytic transglycosylase RlpA family protein [Solirubrobacteraceae bacterium]|nr:septal ring lytic transglycosylase RlpA family protein [Solirubrobacteraceae bacterium]